MKSIIILSFSFLLLISCNTTIQNNEKIKEQPDSAKLNSKEIVSEKPKDIPFKEGENLVKYDNGKLKFQGFMNNGKREGLWRSFYENGAKWSETTFLEGKKNGKTTTWYENSQMRYDGFYTNDVESGKWTFWDEKGKEIQTKEYDRK